MEIIWIGVRGMNKFQHASQDIYATKRDRYPLYVKLYICISGTSQISLPEISFFDCWPECSSCQPSSLCSVSDVSYCFWAKMWQPLQSMLGQNCANVLLSRNLKHDGMMDQMLLKISLNYRKQIRNDSPSYFSFIRNCPSVYAHLAMFSLRKW